MSGGRPAEVDAASPSEPRPHAVSARAFRRPPEGPRGAGVLAALACSRRWRKGERRWRKERTRLANRVARTEPAERGAQEVLGARSSSFLAHLLRRSVERPARFALLEAEATQASEH